MKRYSINRYKWVIIIFVILLVFGLFVFKSMKPNISEYSSLEAAIKELKIQKDDTFNIVERKKYAYIQISNGSVYQAKLFSKENKEKSITYILKDELTDENFFTKTSKVIDIKNEKKILSVIQESPEIFKEDRDVYTLTTTDKRQTKIKINGKKAAVISKYEKKGVTFYFLLFEQVDFQHEITVEI